MSLARKAIRRAIGERLMNRTAAKQRVYANRAEPVWEAGTPAILIRTPREEDTVLSSGPRRYSRALTVTIGCCSNETPQAGADDVADDLAQQVEDLLLHDPGFKTSPKLNALIDAKETRIVSGELGVEIGERVYAGWTITMQVTFQTEHLPPNERTLSPLEAFDVDWDFPPPGVDEELEAEDEIEVPVT